MVDAHTNFAYSTVAGTSSNNGTNPGTTGIKITVQNGDSAFFPSPPFNATVWPAGTQPLTSNAEIVRVTAINDDTLTLDDTNHNGTGNRQQQEGTSARSIIVGDQIAADVTAKTLTDAEAPIKYWTPWQYGGTGQTGLQTLGGTAQATTNSLFVFPVTVPPNLQFNQVLIGASLSMVTSSVAASHTYSSMFGIYSMNGNSALSLISSNSFSIQETLSSRTLTWNYPATTATAGYSSTSVNLTTTGPMSSFISGTRLIGLAFTNSMSLSGGVYYMGMLSVRSTANTNSTFGLSLAGLVGQPINTVNAVSGSMVALGVAASAWSGNNTNQTQWWGRPILGIVTATSLANFGGSAIPASINITALGTTGGAGSTATILPSVTFVST